MKPKKPPFPSFASSAVAQIKAGLMDEYLDAVIGAAQKRQSLLDRAERSGRDEEEVANTART